LPVALDTGAPVAVSVPSSFEDTLPLQAASAVTGHRRTVDSSQEVRSARLAGDVTIGTYAIAEPMVSFSERASYGHLGMEILGQFALTIDRSNHRIAFAQGDATPKPAAGGGPQRKIVRAGGSKGYGIRLAGVGGDTLDVLGVDEGASAAAGGLRAGDRILALNGRPVKELSDSERVAALRGSPLRLLVERAGQERELTLSLE
jgi:hypothetical protein